MVRTALTISGQLRVWLRLLWNGKGLLWGTCCTRRVSLTTVGLVFAGACLVGSCECASRARLAPMGNHSMCGSLETPRGHVSYLIWGNAALPAKTPGVVLLFPSALKDHERPSLQLTKDRVWQVVLGDGGVVSQVFPGWVVLYHPEDRSLQVLAKKWDRAWMDDDHLLEGSIRDLLEKR
jgi:hypothetical protein